jgi:hypothetical protein
LGEYGLMSNCITACGDVDVERLLRSLPQRCKHGSDGLMTGPCGAKARGMCCQLRFPCGFEDLTHQGLSSSIRLGGHAERAGVRGGTPVGKPEAPERAGCPVETALVGQAPAPRRREGLDPIDAGGVPPSVVLREATHREQPRIPCLSQPFLQLVYGSHLATVRGAVHALLEAEDLPLNLRPRHGLPGHLQGVPLRCGPWPLTHPFPLHETGPTSASPGHSPRPWRLRASSSHGASGWPLLREVTSLSEGHGRFLRSHRPWCASGGRGSPPGFSAVHTGHSRRLPAPSPGSC